MFIALICFKKSVGQSAQTQKEKGCAENIIQSADIGKPGEYWAGKILIIIPPAIRPAVNNAVGKLTEIQHGIRRRYHGAKYGRWRRVGELAGGRLADAAAN